MSSAAGRLPDPWIGTSGLPLALFCPECGWRVELEQTRFYEFGDPVEDRMFDLEARCPRAECETLIKMQTYRRWPP